MANDYITLCFKFAIDIKFWKLDCLVLLRFTYRECNNDKVIELAELCAGTEALQFSNHSSEFIQTTIIPNLSVLFLFCGLLLFLKRACQRLLEWVNASRFPRFLFYSFLAISCELLFCFPIGALSHGVRISKRSEACANSCSLGTIFYIIII